jgi:hypothetical protein
MPSARPRPRIAATIEPACGSVGTPARNERSILRIWTGRLAQARQRRVARAEVVDRQGEPRLVQIAHERAGARGWLIALDSVTSTQKPAASRP